SRRPARGSCRAGFGESLCCCDGGAFSNQHPRASFIAVAWPGVLHFVEGEIGKAFLARVERECLRPETVAVRILAVADEPDIAGGGGFLFDPAQVAPQVFVLGVAERAVLVRAAQREGEIFFYLSAETHRFHAIFAKALLRALGELHAEAGGID